MTSEGDRRLLATLQKPRLLRRDNDTALWRGQDPVLGPVLVSVVVGDPPSPQVLSRLAHEFRLREKLDAGWAVRPLRFDTVGDSAELVLDDPGGSLLESLLANSLRSESGRSGLDIESFLILGLRMAEALGVLHHRGLIHKDVRPANILVAPDGETVRFTGFGYASPLPRHRTAVDLIETIEGSLAYVAPEQTGRMNRSVDSRSDLYSLGITFFEMLIGHPPFVSEDPVELVHFHVARRPQKLSRLREDIPGPISDIVMKLLSKAAEDRYQTASGLAADLRRCLDAWRTFRSVLPFRLALNDIPDHLTIPEKLYGRDDELSRLRAAAERVSTQGAFEVVLVGGYSGIGKSALVGELHKALIEPRALFVSGKFDQYKRHVPYSTWVQAFQGAVRRILGQDDRHIAEWRRTVLNALGQNGRLITELIPELALLIGEQPAVPELPPSESQNRFFGTFRRFLDVWATPQHPLVLFLDDLQWVDPGSLKLLEYLVTRGDLRHLLLICAYRDNEVGPTHPFSFAISSIRTRVRLEEIVLKPLSQDDLCQMIAETLSCPQSAAKPFADLIGRKTEGNPFFVIQFMHRLFEEGLLSPDVDGWHWDFEKIARVDYTDNVVDLMIGKLRRFPETTQNVIRQLAFLGNVASIRKLQMVYDGQADTLDAGIEEALRASYVVRSGDTVRFAHDRIQEAAYSLLQPEERPAEHLRIGHALAAALDPAEIEDGIFEIVNHYNLASALLTNPDERSRIRFWNMLAGKKAKASAAYATAHAFFEQAADLLPPTAWDDDYEQTLSLFLERLGCELLLSNFRQIDASFPVVLGRARTNADRARVHRLRILRYQVTGQYGEAVKMALEALRMFGLDCPTLPDDIAAAVAQGRQDVSVNLGGRDIAALIDSPLMTDPDALAMIGILVDAMPCSALAWPELYDWLVLTALNTTLRLGNTGDSCSVYMGYAIVLVSKYDEYEASMQFADVALMLQEKAARPDLKGRILVRKGVYINSRRKSLRSSVEILTDGFIECTASGDYSYAAYGALEASWLVLESGAQLSELTASSMRFASFAEQAGNSGLAHSLRVQVDFAAFLTGTTGFDSFMGRSAESVEALVNAKFGTGVAYAHLLRQMAAFLFGHADLAMEHGVRVSAYLKSITGWVAETTYHFLAVLALTARHDVRPETEREARRAELARHIDLLAARARECPQNYGSRYSLAAAEVARIDGRPLEAERLYDEAIRSAHDNGFLHISAMAHELAARFYQGRGLVLIADAYRRKARDCYARWGAFEKVRQLEADYPDLVDKHGRTGAETHGQVQNLDVLSVVKASQAVSGEIALDRLVATLLRIAMENAGAERGALIVDLAGTLTVVADARIGDGDVVVRSLRQEPNGSDLPERVLNYVHRVRNSVLLDDATQDNDFSADEYLSANKVKSVLCLPLIKQSRLIGVLYLENSQVSHVFTADRVAVLDLLASQAAISLENALLYENLERHRDDLEHTVALRTAALNAAKRLAEEKSEQVATLLDNSGQGFLSFGADLIVDREYSRACEAMLGEIPAGKNAATLLFPGDQSRIELLRMGVPMALGEADPERRDIIVSLFPAELRRDQMILRAGYTMLDKGRMMVVLTDITEERRLEEKVRREHRLLQMVVAAVTIGRDFFVSIEAFREFVRTGLPAMLHSQRPVTEVLEDLYREIHTFKGTLNQFSFNHAPQALHGLEEQLGDMRRRVDVVSIADIEACLASVSLEECVERDLDGLREIAGEGFLEKGERLTITAEQAIAMEKLASSVLLGERIDTAAPKMRRLLIEIGCLRKPLIRDVLAGYGRTVIQVATRLEKAVAPIEINGGEDIWLDRQIFDPFLRSLVHVFRNAVAHGIEDPETRVRLGKAEQGRIVCSVLKTGKAIELTISDDGRGINPDTVLTAAVENSLLTQRTAARLTEEEVLELIFLKGVTTTGHVDQLSGRGIGLAAVRSEVLKLGGKMKVRSTLERGTTFLISLPFEEGVITVT